LHQRQEVEKREKELEEAWDQVMERPPAGDIRGKRQEAVEVLSLDLKEVRCPCIVGFLRGVLQMSFKNDMQS
jgi:hypothetical protein